MTSPKRTEIRNAIVQLLRVRVPEVVERVYPNRRRQVNAANLPCILVDTLGEAVTVSNQSPRELERRLNVDVTIQCRDVEKNNLDEELDQLGEKVELAFERRQTLAGVASDSLLTGISLNYSDEGDGPIGSLTLSFAITYYRVAPELTDDELVGDANGPFVGINNEWDVPEHTGPATGDQVPDAKDTLDLEQ